MKGQRDARQRSWASVWGKIPPRSASVLGTIGGMKLWKKIIHLTVMAPVELTCEVTPTGDVMIRYGRVVWPLPQLSPKEIKEQMSPESWVQLRQWAKELAEAGPH